MSKSTYYIVQTSPTLFVHERSTFGGYCEGRGATGGSTSCIRRRFAYDTFVWDAEQWDEYKAAHPEIGQKLAEIAAKAANN